MKKLCLIIISAFFAFGVTAQPVFNVEIDKSMPPGMQKLKAFFDLFFLNYYEDLTEEQHVTSLMQGIDKNTAAVFKAQGQPTKAPKSTLHPQMQRLKDFVYFYLERNKQRSFSDKEVESIIKNFLYNIDNYGEYYPPQDEGFVKYFKNYHTEIGLQCYFRKDTLLVDYVKPESSARNSGFRPNDRIVAIDGKQLADLEPQEIASMLSKKAGTRITATVIRDNGKPFDLTLQAENIGSNPISASFIVEPGIGYMKFDLFSNGAFQNLKKAVEELENFGELNTLIIDLWNNPGGAVPEEMKIANFFLPRDSLLFTDQGRNWGQKRFYMTSEPGFKGNLIIMANEGSASASESLTAVLQDYDRAVVVGRQTFGKSVAQNEYKLPDGSTFKMTSAKYMFPSGREINIRYKYGRGSEREKVQFDPQDSTYLSRILRRPLPAHCGVMPDYWVEFNSDGLNEYYGAMEASGTLSYYANEFVNQHYNDILSEYKTLHNFANNYKISDQMLDECIELGKSLKIEPDEKQLKEADFRLRNAIARYIARNIWGINGMIAVQNMASPVVAKAYEVARDWDNQSKGIVGMDMK